MVAVDTIVVSPDLRIVLGVCRSVGCGLAVTTFVAADLIVVDDINRGPSDLILCTAEAFVTVTMLLADDAKFDEAALPSLLIEKTM